MDNYTKEQTDRWYKMVDPLLHNSYTKRARFLNKEEISFAIRDFGDSKLTVEQFCYVTKIPYSIFKKWLSIAWKERVDDVNYIYMQIENLKEELEVVIRIAKGLAKELDSAYSYPAAGEPTPDRDTEELAETIDNEATVLEVASENLDKIISETKVKTPKRFKWC